MKGFNIVSAFGLAEGTNDIRSAVSTIALDAAAGVVSSTGQAHSYAAQMGRAILALLYVVEPEEGKERPSLDALREQALARCKRIIALAEKADQSKAREQKRAMAGVFARLAKVNGHWANISEANRLAILNGERSFQTEYNAILKAEAEAEKALAAEAEAQSAGQQASEQASDDNRKELESKPAFLFQTVAGVLADLASDEPRIELDDDARAALADMLAAVALYSEAEAAKVAKKAA